MPYFQRFSEVSLELSEGAVKNQKHHEENRDLKEDILGKIRAEGGHIDASSLWIQMLSV